MRVAELAAYHEPLRVTEWPDPALDPEGAIVRVEGCGVCGSDWHVWRGDWRWRMTPALPHVLGHEVAGTVVAVGRGCTRWREGDRVIVPFHLSCGRCPQCTSGHPNTCDRYTAIGFGLPGGFAEQLAVPGADLNLVALPDTVSFDAAAALGCRYMTAWHALTDVLQVPPGEPVAVVGCGGLGLAAIQVALSRGHPVYAFDRNPAAVRCAAELGAHAADIAEGAEPARAATAGGVAAAIDAVGEQETLDHAIALLRKRGTLVRLGLTGERARGTLQFAADLVVKSELAVLGAIGCPPASLAALVAEVGAGRLDPRALVRHAVALDGITPAFAAMDRGAGSGMTIVRPWG